MQVVARGCAGANARQLLVGDEGDAVAGKARVASAEDALAAKDELARGLERDGAAGIHLPTNRGVGVGQFEALTVCSG